MKTNDSFYQALRSELKQTRFYQEAREEGRQEGLQEARQKAFEQGQLQAKLAIVPRTGVLFFPNCKARLNTPEGRDNEEPDFLVCYNGKLGILEVDGEPWHPASRTVHDHQRDRLFKVHGIRVVEHYDAKRCSEQPDLVVQEFLEILKNA